jgi:hypothetical protein
MEGEFDAFKITIFSCETIRLDRGLFMPAHFTRAGTIEFKRRD